MRAAALTAMAICLSLASGARAVERSTLTADVEGQSINVYFYQPAGPGPFPLIVLSHGVPRERSDFGKIGPNELRGEAVALADRGIAVAVPIRRGYGGQGDWREGYGGCEKGDFYAAGMAGAKDIEAAISVASKQPSVDPSRVVLIGVSGGGWASLAAATHGGVLGVVSFAGGRGNRAYEQVCKQDNLIEAAGRFGAETKAPELWIYSANDHVFNPELANRMFKAFTDAGGQAVFRAAPPYGRDGHAYIEDISSWRATVDSFLKVIGFIK
jgi:dienelactone hydrolase